MKKNIKFLFAACVASLATSCTDLDVTPESQYTEYPENEIAVEAKMSDIYYYLRDMFGRRYMEAQSLSSDEFTAISFGGGYYDGGCYSHPSYHAFTKEDASLDWMHVLTEGIAKANKVIVEMGGNEAGAGVAQPRAMRAFFHFLMMDAWGDAPILDHALAENEQIDRSPRADVARFIEKELLEVIPDLNEEVSENTYGKPTKWMAEALLAKLYINWAVYTAASVDQYDAATATNEKLDDCVRLCDDIIQSGKFNLGSMPYRMKFAPNNGYKVEDFIYAMPYDTYTATGMQYGRAHSWKGVKDCEKSYYGMKLSQSAGGWIVMTPEFSSLFSLPGDERNGCVLTGQVYVHDPATLLPTSEVAIDKNGNPIVISPNIELAKDEHGNMNWEQIDVGNNEQAFGQGAHSIKYYVIDDDYKNGRNQSNDVPIFRYADILLTKAEAIVRGAKATNGDTPQSLFNQVRTYAKAPTLDHAPSLQELLDERGRELFAENWRRNDMIRFGTFESEFFPHYKNNPYASFDKRRRVFPLNNRDLEVNPNWQQNPGY